MLEVFETKLKGVFLVAPSVYHDNRGYFFESYNHAKYAPHIQPLNFIQDNESFSHFGTLRGLHYQLPPYEQAKLVRVIKGRVLDVVLDLRRSSPTFGRYIMAELNETNKHQLYIPRGFAHGFLVLSDTAIFAYKVDNNYNKESEAAINCFDPRLNIPWGLPREQMILSVKDKYAPFLKDAIVFEM